MTSQALSLMNLQPTITHFTQMLSQVLGLEVEIVDNRLLRVAGSGPYRSRIGHPPEHRHLLQYVVDHKKEKVVIHSRHDPVCRRCGEFGRCGELAFLGLPVMHEGVCLGVISLAAITPEQQRRLQENIDVFSDYVRHVSSLLMANLTKSPAARHDMDALFTTLINSMDQGILALDEHGMMTFANQNALTLLNARRETLAQGPIAIRPLVASKDFANGNAQHVVAFANRQEVVIGQHHRGNALQLFLFAFHQSERPAPIDAADSEPRIGPFIGHAPAIQTLKQRIARFADSPSSIMITGESGSGKEMLARAIHQLGRRGARPFVAINCAAIPEHLLESELFGYVKGAFTGAAPNGKAGLIQSAHGGTLFLDEIGDMPLTLQAKLLRVLETREVMPLGAAKPVAVDIRIVSATHQDLARAIADGAFREDLYYRLKVIPIEIPPLRERTEDIELLAHHFLNLHTLRIGSTYPGVSREVMALLRHYRWPGNVRELSNLMEYLVNIVPDGEVIDPTLLPPHFHQAGPAATPPTAAATRAGAPSLKQWEHQRIEDALRRGIGKKQLAQELEISLATLYRKIKKYGLSDLR
ncbi:MULTISPECIES: sigma-54 interaction domain-containing protein [Lonsdalea]|uniref:Sigma-54-dependent Fis family transcriptional regulator n=2 Tax=Lonsdalea TaxID=1082702 RepID=A0ACD1J9W6_9GAMM|nr:MULTISPECIES: sigma 54-interacting transcriptional regulator [Lonsdalea]OSM95681.1 sigma-54-dependent Fis family transcriptional regulator [Lonsdalea populi]QPQ23140.1 sigma 54-interacting transcriptional regulator [Lonsdalea populi]RAT11826.1 sigma-54-dependent Fis family transcriptional regulator [Lonsdalea quercina]RAT21625.1 sigma-54-dependent Fis family transcriptional regulator [Lonsdalea populi]RAT22375.1 sigma-54-dependent Fis family transcriptional regulator [Lonsdalea populi]